MLKKLSILKGLLFFSGFSRFSSSRLMPSSCAVVSCWALKTLLGEESWDEEDLVGSGYSNLQSVGNCCFEVNTSTSTSYFSVTNNSILNIIVLLRMQVWMIKPRKKIKNKI